MRTTSYRLAVASSPFDRSRTSCCTVPVSTTCVCVVCVCVSCVCRVCVVCVCVCVCVSCVCVVCVFRVCVCVSCVCSVCANAEPQAPEAATNPLTTMPTRMKTMSMRDCCPEVERAPALPWPLQSTATRKAMGRRPVATLKACGSASNETVLCFGRCLPRLHSGIALWHVCT